MGLEKTDSISANSHAFVVCFPMYCDKIICLLSCAIVVKDVRLNSEHVEYVDSG